MIDWTVDCPLGDLIKYFLLQYNHVQNGWVHSGMMLLKIKDGFVPDTVSRMKTSIMSDCPHSSAFDLFAQH